MTTLDEARRSAAVAPAAAPRKRLGDVLVEKGLLTDADLALALTRQGDGDGPRRRLGTILVEEGLVSEAELARSLAELLGLQHVDLSRLNVAPDVVRQLPRAVAERCRVLVLDRTPEYLLIAASDPTNVMALDDVKLYTRAPEVHVVVALDSQIRDHLARAWSLSEDTSQVTRMVEEATDEDEEPAVDMLAAGAADDTPIVKLVNQILSDAVRLRCSDIHLESQRTGLRVRFRVDGLLRDVMSAPKRLAPAVISRIKIISGLDISERRIPQDGRTRVTVDGHAIDCRVSTLPALHGEKVVIRLLTRGDDVPSLESLGFEDDQLEVFRRALSVPQGLVLITGPTGSGKTNTLYAAIHATMSPEKNIITLEDPVEVQLPGITQVQVHPKVGMTFSAGLRSVLRQDPDIVLIGEVRDTETAELALKASMTGHLVLTTLHTNSAVAALTRLVDMGAAPFLVASSLTCAIAQRLVRRPCDTCAEGYIPDETLLTALDLSIEDILDATPLKGAGCPECGGTGYRGRTAIYEVLDIVPSVRKVLLTEATEAALEAEAARIGMSSLRDSALRKAMRGETTFEEVLRVTAG
ncbi:GspE/PulE family protein [Kineococcus gynurae]|uniref:GspE/PulE family protein n=1 Tax=Kineococcus gynurae TaxID=452979 RepID=A0ABV5LNA8_9ACTN